MAEGYFEGVGDRSVHTVDSAGNISEPLVTFPQEPYAIQFGAGGAFGTDLYATVKDNEGSLFGPGTVYRVKPDGTLSPFVTDLGMSHFSARTLAFRPDGSAMYVSDYAENMVYEIVPNLPPEISVSSPANNSEFAAGSSVLVTGHVEVDRPYLSVAYVAVNEDTLVDRLDSSGNFFSQVIVRPGQNVFDFTVTDTAGRQATATLTLLGVQPTPGEIDFSLFSDVTASLEGEYGRTSFNEKSDVLYAGMVVHNAGQYPADTPLLVGITNISDPTVRVREPDGLTPEGIPYYNYSDLVAGGTLHPGERTGERTLAFFNPNRIQFTYDLIFLGQLNQAPRFLTVPDVEALAGRPYSYDSDATDPDEDPVSYSLAAGPQGAVVDPTTGEITWAPTANDLGNHAIVLRAEDGRGGSTEQHYVLSVIEPPPNRPPYFTSVPVVDVQVNQPYFYDSDAFDPDDDALTYGLLIGSSGMIVGPTTGELEWTPSSNQVGTHSVTLEASDGRGGSATQSYVIQVRPDPSNHPPLIVSEPVTEAVVGKEYTYDVDAIDPEEDPLQYSLVEAPEGMAIEPETGMVTWQTPEPIPSFSDDFEGAQLDPFWTLREQAAYVTFPSITQAHGGGQSVQFNTTSGSGRKLVGLEHTFEEAVFGTFSVWLYDTGAGSTSGNFLEFYADNSTSGDYAIVYAQASQGSRYYAGTSAAAVSPSATSRTIGWHHFVIDSTPQSLVLKVDGETVQTRLDPMPIDRITFNMNGSAPSRECYFDDFEFINNTPLPTVDVTVRADDDRGGYDTQSFVIQIQPNRPPVIVSEPVTTISAGRQYIYDVDAVDPDNDELTYSLHQGPEDMSIDPATGLIEWNVPSVEPSFSDDFEASSLDPFWSTNSSSGFITLPSTETAHSGTQSVKFSTFDSGVHKQVDLYHNFSEPVYGRFSVWVYDTGASSAVRNYVNMHVWHGDTYSTIAAFSSGTMEPFYRGGRDGDPFVSTVRRTVGWHEFEINATIQETQYFVDGTLVHTSDGRPVTAVYLDQKSPWYDPPWSYYFDDFEFVHYPPNVDVTVRVDDDNGGYDTQSFVIQIQPNRPPQIVSEPVTTVLAGEEYAYDVDAIDPDDDPLVYSLVERPQGMVIDSGSGLISWPNPDAAAGRTVVSDFVDTDESWSVSDGGTLTHVASSGNPGGFLELRVTDTQTPKLTATAPGKFLGDLLEFNHGVLSFDAHVIQHGTPAIPYPAFGEVTIRGSSGTATLDAIYEETADSWTTFSIPLAATAWDKSPAEWEAILSDVVEISVELKPFSCLVVVGLDNFSIEAPPAEQITVQVEDDHGGSDLQSYTLSIVENRPPEILVQTVAPATERRDYSYQIEANDPDGDSLTYTLVDGGDQMSIDPATGEITWTDFSPDPKFDFAFGIGSSGHDYGRQVTTDEAGNFYITGQFWETVDVDPGPGVVELTSAGGSDIYVAKYNPDGSLMWAHRVGGSRSEPFYHFGGTEWTDGLAIDGAGNVYVTGEFEGMADFDPGPDVFAMTSAGDLDAFIWKLDTNGNFVWARRLGGTGRDRAFNVVVDGIGNIYTNGYFESDTMDFSPGSGVPGLTRLGTRDIFVLKLDCRGDLIWARQIGAPGEHF
jgi:hypothetical protein